MIHPVEADSQTVLIGHGTTFDRVPVARWRADVRRSNAKTRHRLDFMTPDHHSVRNFVVTALGQLARPVTFVQIADRLRIPASHVRQLVDELERNLFFLVRNPAGDIAWAFPLTAYTTPHEVSINSGAHVFGACAEDAFAAAFVLGTLFGTPLRVDIQSTCGQSGRPFRLTVGNDLTWRIHSGDTALLLFTPNVDWNNFRAPNIIDDY